MTISQRENIRLSILRYCERAEEFGLAETLLLQFIRNEGLRSLTPAQFRAEIIYLADKSLLANVPKIVSPENSAWRITAAGRDFLAAQKLEDL